MRNLPEIRGPNPWALLGGLILFAATLVVYAPVRHFAFVELDDTLVLGQVRDGLSIEGIRWALQGHHVFPPLVWVAHMLDAELFGLAPGAHHLSNLFLHAINAVLLYWVLSGLTGRPGPSFFVAALFALHPLNVESVAWVAQKKSVLSTLFWILGMGAYGRYARSGSRPARAAVLACLLLGLASKPTLVTFPFVLLLLDLWPLRRWQPFGDDPSPASLGALLREKAALFALAAVASLWTLRVQTAAGAVASTSEFSVAGRLGNAVVSYGHYLRRLVWPNDLAPFYPHLDGLGLKTWSGGDLALAAFVLAGLTAVSLRTLRGWPFGFVGFAWFLGVMVPMIGLVQVGGQALADRYMYVPIIGCGLALAWTADALVAKRPYVRRPVVAIATVVLVLFAGATRAYLPHWSDTLRLWERSLAMEPHHYIAANNIAWLLATCPEDATRDAERAVLLAERAVELTRRDDASHLDTLAAAYAEAGRFDDATSVQIEALRLAQRTGETTQIDAMRRSLTQLRQARPIRSRQGCPGHGPLDR